jgi:hypothetical protein
VAVKVVMLEVLLETETDCVVGAALFAGNVKLSELGMADKGLDPGEFALSVTGMIRDPAVEVTLMKPALVPEVGAPDPIETVSDSGVTPLLALTDSQFPVEDADTATFTGVLESTVRFCVVEPGGVLNVSWEGLEARTFCARAVSKQLSRMERSNSVEKSERL